ncbi:MAG: hypothetical protein ACRCYC_15795 [Paraclostridium sp.]|uniref:hypothetical protein n=1 Tax=Paraclostridium sp. TaxID=2023273 RepID=UPI003F3D923B
MINVNKGLYEYIHSEMGAEYYQNHNDVMVNIDNDFEQNLKYLGTYFPRSFKEAYVIYSNIFSNSNIYNEFLLKDTINILDIGSGTGGNLLGLLQVICEMFENKEINIVSIDGNESALDVQKKLIENMGSFIKLNSNEIKCELYTIKFENKEDIESEIEKILDHESIDILQSFKFLNELYNINFSKNKGSYKVILDIGEKYLKRNGLLCLVDVTSRVGNREFMSIIINTECREYFKSTNSDLKYIIPVCCAFNHDDCVRHNTCFSRYEINTSYRRWSDVSKISYKLFIKKSLGEFVLDDIYKGCCDETENCHCLNITVNNNCTKLSSQPYCL